MVHNNDDAMNKIPLKSSSGLDDEEKNGGEFVHDTAVAEEARREQMRANVLKWMKKLTIVLICFIGIALISYVIISLCFSDDSHNNNKHSNAMLANNSTSHIDNSINDATKVASFGLLPDRNVAETTTNPTNTAFNSGPSPSTVPAETITTTTTTTKTTEKPAQTEEKPNLQASTTALRDVPITDMNFKSKLGVYKRAAVCSDKEVCSQAGSQILEKGGSAVDAAITTLLCNGIVTMHSMGIGGGMLMNVYIKDTKHAYSIDGREVAPFAAFPEMFDKNYKLSADGGLAIAVPGELMGYHRAHERFGKLPWKTLVEPSIQICKEGYYLSQSQWKALKWRQQGIQNNTILRNVFMNADTFELHPVGTKLQPPKELCETYVLLAQNGPLDFYNGTLANLVVEDLKDLGSTVTSYDLETYGADLVSSITMQLGEGILYAAPPVSSGTVVANILSVLEGYNFTKADLVGPANEARTIHRMAEAMKFAFAKRWELGDLRFNDVRELVSKLTNPEYSIDIRHMINDSNVRKSIFEYGAQFSGTDDHGTSQVVVLAPNGDAVSVTSSVNHYFGAGQTGKRTGIIFNNGMNDFSIQGHSNIFDVPLTPSNSVDARKRPMSSMSPMLLADQQGNIHMAWGAAGGTKIISAVVEVAARVLWFGQNIKEAIDAPRFHHQLLPNVLEYEAEHFSEEILALLKAKGHVLEPFHDVGSVICGIVRNETAIYANADYRKHGGTAGF